MARREEVREYQHEYDKKRRKKMAKQRTYSIYRNVETDDMFIDKDGLHFRRYKVFACGMNKSGAEWLMSIEEDHKKFMKGENL